MKIASHNTLASIIVFISILSCEPSQNIEQLSNNDQGVKSSKENTENSTNTLATALNSYEENILLESDEIDISNQILIQINNYRNSVGLEDLINNDTAKIQALTHSKYQADKNHMNHDNTASRSSAIFKEENAILYGENVAFGYSSIEKLIQAWINSESHRENIEGDFKYSGVGTIANEKGVLYFTQLFFK